MENPDEPISAWFYETLEIIDPKTGKVIGGYFGPPEVIAALRDSQKAKPQ